MYQRIKAYNLTKVARRFKVFIVSDGDLKVSDNKRIYTTTIVLKNENKKHESFFKTERWIFLRDFSI